MTKTFKVPKVETVDFCSLVAGDYFFNNTYYIKLIKNDDDCSYNSVNLERGVLASFCSGARVKPYKDCEVILYE